MDVHPISELQAFQKILELTRPVNGSTELLFKYSVNSSGQNKDWDYRKLTTDFRNVTGTVEELLQNVKAGYAINGAWFNGNRAKVNVIGVQLLLIDIDNTGYQLDRDGKPIKDAEGKRIPIYSPELTIEDALAHSFVQKYCAFIYTTASHKPDWHKLRLGFVLPEVLNAETYESLASIVLKEFPHDPACKDAGRVFYGNTKAEIILCNPHAVLNSSFIEAAKVKKEQDAIARQEREAQLKQRRQELRQDWYSSGRTEQDLQELVREALTYIPPRQKGSGNYHDCLKILTALKNEFGDNNAIALAEEWSPTSYKESWNIERKITGLHNTNIGIGTIFYFAQQNGWSFPKGNFDYQSWFDKHLEPDPIAYQEYCLRLCEEEKIEEAIAKSEFLQYLKSRVKGLAKKFHKGFGQYAKLNKPLNLPKVINFSPDTPLPTPQDYQNKEPPRIRFKKGQRHRVITLLNQLGWQFILDRSFMGFGKSHDMGNFVNSEGKTWYLDLNHRNPSVSTVEDNFTDLPVRHNGLNYDELRATPSGQPYQVWAAEDDDDPDITSLCHNAHLFIKLHKKSYPIDSLRDFEENSLNPICKGCRYQGQRVEDEKGEKIAICAAQKGNGYGFRFARRLGLAQSQIRASINSLPSLSEYDYSNDLAIVEEASTIITGTKTVTANLQDFSTKFLQLLEQAPELFNLLEPVRNKLFPFLSGETKIVNYGLNHAQILELLGEPDPESSIAEILELVTDTNPEFEELFVQAVKHKKWGKDWRNSQNTANWFESVQAREMTIENINRLPSNFLTDLLSVWYGMNSGALRLDYQGLKITTDDPTHGEKLREMKQVILLDATGNKRQLAKHIGINDHSIIEIQQEIPSLSNLTVINLEMPGLGSNQYSDTAIARLTALLDKIKERYGKDIPVLGLKKYWQALDLDGNWFNDNRGSNRFKAQNAIAALGTPRINLGVAEDEYLTLYGTLEGFEDYYQSLIEAEITQLIGRPRAHLYPEQEFLIYIVGTNQNLDYLKQYGINVVNRHAFEVTPEAGTKNQFAKWKLLRALHSLKQAGQKITQQNLARAATMSQSYLNEIVKTWAGGWRAFKKLSDFLIDFYRSSDKIWRTFELKTEAKIKDWLGLEPVAALEELAQIIINEDWEAYEVYAECNSGDVLSTAWGLLARLILPQEVILDFDQILASPPS